MPINRINVGIILKWSLICIIGKFSKLFRIGNNENYLGEIPIFMYSAFYKAHIHVFVYTSISVVNKFIIIL